MALTPVTDARRLVEAMTLAERAGQMVMVGFPGTAAPRPVLEMVAEQGLGGIIYFSRNVEHPRQTASLSASLQAAAGATRLGVPLAIAIDQEGGIVVRLPSDGGYAHFPGNMALGATRDAGLARQAAAAMAREMRAVGINFNLAPVLDVNNNPANPVIGVRSYGADPHLVAELGAAAAAGYQEGGVAACGKHFPGHGDTAVDSHLDLPVVPHGRQRLDAVELVPFRAAIGAGIDAIMTAHIFFPAVEPEPGLPATLSRRVIDGLLRRELGFDGVICTDCLEMKGVAGAFEPEEIALRAVEAGVDVLLVSHTLPLARAMLAALIGAVRSGRLSEERISASAYRILRMKERRQMGLAPAPEAAPDLVGTAGHLALAAAVARRAVTAGWDRGVLPLRRGARVALVLPQAVMITMVEDSLAVMAPFIQVLEQELGPVEVVTCPLDMGGFSAGALAERLGPGGTVVFGAVMSGRYGAQAEAAAALKAAGCRVVVLGRRMPYDLAQFRASADAAIAIYDDSPAMLQAGAEVLLGRLQPAGRLPVPADPEPWKDGASGAALLLR